LSQLLVSPISDGRAQALATTCLAVAAYADHYIRSIMKPLATELAVRQLGPPLEQDSVMWKSSAQVVCALGQDERALSTLVPELVDLVALPDDPAIRRAGLALLGALFAKGSALEIQIPLVLKTIIRLFADSDASVLAQAVATFGAVLRRIGLDLASSHIDYIRNSIRTIASVDKHKAANRGKDEYSLPALQLPGGLDALLEVYLFALVNGSNEARESAAQGMGEVVDMTSSAALKPYVVKMTGPLIRIVGDRFPGSVKSAILDALKKLLVKGGAILKPFLPQLQTTFVKSLQNTVDAVRSSGLAALEEMIPLLTRLDPLVQEFVLGVAQADAGVRLDMLRALLFALVTRGKEVSVLSKITEHEGAVFVAVRDWELPGVRVVAAAVEAAALKLQDLEFVSERHV